MYWTWSTWWNGTVINAFNFISQDKYNSAISLLIRAPYQTTGLVFSDSGNPYNGQKGMPNIIHPPDRHRYRRNTHDYATYNRHDENWESY